MLAYLGNQKLFQKLKETTFCYETTKVTKTTRGKEYIEEIKYEYDNRINKLNDEMNDLRWQLTELEQIQFESLNDRDKLAKLYVKGLINSNGEIKDE